MGSLTCCWQRSMSHRFFLLIVGSVGKCFFLEFVGKLLSQGMTLLSWQVQNHTLTWALRFTESNIIFYPIQTMSWLNLCGLVFRGILPLGRLKQVWFPLTAYIHSSSKTFPFLYQLSIHLQVTLPFGKSLQECHVPVVIKGIKCANLERSN